MSPAGPNGSDSSLSIFAQSLAKNPIDAREKMVSAIARDPDKTYPLAHLCFRSGHTSIAKKILDSGTYTAYSKEQESFIERDHYSILLLKLCVCKGLYALTKNLYDFEKDDYMETILKTREWVQNGKLGFDIKLAYEMACSRFKNALESDSTQALRYAAGLVIIESGLTSSFPSEILSQQVYLHLKEYLVKQVNDEERFLIAEILDAHDKNREDQEKYKKLEKTFYGRYIWPIVSTARYQLPPPQNEMNRKNR